MSYRRHQRVALPGPGAIQGAAYPPLLMAAGFSAGSADPGRGHRLLGRALYSGRAHPDRWHSVLVLRPCCIGDVLQSTALVAALRRALPGARIGYAVGAWSRPVLEHNPDLDQLIDTGAVIGGRVGNMRSYVTLARVLRQGNWDACFVLERSPLFSLVAWAGGIRDRIGLDSAGRGVALTVRVPVNPRRHEADSYLDLAAATGIPIQGARTAVHTTPENDAEAERVLGRDAGAFVAIGPGGGVNPGTTLLAKRWPAPLFGELARRLASRGLSSVVIGGASDRDLGAVITGAAGAAVRDLSGRLSLLDTAAVLRRAAAFVGNDTGVMHLAAAVGKPVVALFGPTDPATYGPYGDGHRVLWHPTTCGPCFGPRQRRPSCSFECIKSISVDEVEAAVLELVG